MIPETKRSKTQLGGQNFFLQVVTLAVQSWKLWCGTCMEGGIGRVNWRGMGVGNEISLKQDFYFFFFGCFYVELILFLCTRIPSFKAKQIVFILFCLWATAISTVVSQKGKRI